jgi:hypothetical protein
MNKKYESAVRTLNSLGYKFKGGEHWKPPVGNNKDLIPSKLNSEHENWDDYHVSKGSWLWQRLEQLNSRTGCMSYDTPEKGIIRDIWNQLNNDAESNQGISSGESFKVGDLVVWDNNKKLYGRIKSIKSGMATITACVLSDKSEYKKNLHKLKRYSIIIDDSPKEPEPKEWPAVGDKFIHKGELVKCISKGLMSSGDEVITFETADGLSYGSCWNNDSWVKKPPTPEDELRDEIGVYLCEKYNFITGAESLEITEKLLEKYDIKKKPQ